MSSANPTPQQAAGPIWNHEQTVQEVSLTGAADPVTIAGYYVVISNTGANNVRISPSNAIEGVLIPPGGSFETAIVPGSPMFAKGTAGQPLTLIEYV